MSEDQQLRGIRLEDVLEKRRLDQALNAKEFAVCAGVSYSIAREWFRLPGFPVFRGVVFWQDFVQWRTHQNGFASQPESLPHGNGVQTAAAASLPPRAARILQEAR
jgi:hypothetical protein